MDERPQKPPPHRRTRSLKDLLHLPLSSRIGESTSESTLAFIPFRGALCYDIYLEIVEWLWLDEILNLSLTSKTMRALLMPALYDNVILGSTRSCISGLLMLDTHPEVCRWVRRLTIRPNYYLAWPKADKPIDESWIVNQVVPIVRKGCLEGLHSFDWDGHEMAADELWETLRDRCPNLRNISSNIGYNAIDTNSALFTFRNLKSFSFTVRLGLDGSEPFPVPEALPQSLWDMLIEHSPELEELTLSSFSPSTRLFDLSPLLDVHFPRLRILALGCFGYHHDFTIMFDMDSMATWVAKHTSLSYLRFVWSFKRWLSPDEMPMLPGPLLDSYAGVFQQIPVGSSLTMLDILSEPVYESRVGPLCDVLRTLDKLEVMDIWMQVSNPSYLANVLSVCPKLKELHLMSTTVGDWARVVGSLLALHLARLKVFSLTEGHAYRWRQKRMVKIAVGIVRANDRLEQVNLRWVRERCKGRLKQEGRYEVIRGDDGKPTSLLVSERGFTALGSTFSRGVLSRMTM